jgi:gephyrin
MGRGVFEVVSAVTAGDLVSVAISPENRRIIRITTGAPIPPGADTVVMVEDTKLESTDDSGQEERQVAILTEVNVGANIRPVGSDIEQGTLLLPRGTQLSPIGGEIGLLASAGIVEVSVH